MKFEWDITKERVNIRKRGITFEQASYVFSDPFALSKYDDEHSGPEEDRWVLLGNAMNEPLFSLSCTHSRTRKASSTSGSSVHERPRKPNNSSIDKGAQDER
uniref:Uncharacterized conserved protein, DUF497 family n=1 Tax=Candidatus Kentrum sp. LFY TaxID=2126342 RepID=A0A450V3G3_9GAMM|nr:MAG: Uncharacterized conserved protein, DUF497 family [Candidatus Kentron sp. LFY]